MSDYLRGELTDRTTDMNKPRLQGSTQRPSPVRCSTLLDHVVLIHKNLLPQWQRNHGKGIEDSKPSEHSLAKHSAADTVSGGTNEACAFRTLQNLPPRKPNHRKPLAAKERKELKVTVRTGLTTELSDAGRSSASASPTDVARPRSLQ